MLVIWMNLNDCVSKNQANQITVRMQNKVTMESKIRKVATRYLFWRVQVLHFSVPQKYTILSHTVLTCLLYTSIKGTFFCGDVELGLARSTRDIKGSCFAIKSLRSNIKVSGEIKQNKTHWNLLEKISLYSVGLILFIDRIIPVSYTHLDVYKRQHI